MAVGIKILRRRLEAGRKLLLQRYDDEALHQLRVALRRIRALLKQDVDNKHANRLRNALGELAHTTNAARDWDTLYIRARKNLGGPQFEALCPSLGNRRAESHSAVRNMLVSDRWSAVTSELADYVEAGAAASNVGIPKQSDLSKIKHRLGRAWNKAQVVESEKQWHKLRVAIKELRYTLDTVPDDARDRTTKKALKQCKRLQESLGLWHDTVVHRRKVRELADDLDRQSQADLIAALADWCVQMEREGRKCLDQARSRLEDKGTVLFGKASGKQK